MRSFRKYPSNYVKANLSFGSDRWYFGKDEREICGALISELCDGWIISKRIYHCEAGEEFSLQGVADLIKSTHPDLATTYTLRFGSEEEEHEFDLFTVLGALEGMCHNNEAYEVADGFYYVGSYSDWKNDLAAQEQLRELLEQEKAL